MMPYGNIDLSQIDSRIGLLSDGTKPLPEPMVTSHWWGSVMPESNFTQPSALVDVTYNEFENCI